MLTISHASPAHTTEAAPLIVGVGGARRNAAVAAVVNGRLTAFCEQERIARIRSIGLHSGSVPAEALTAVLQSVGRREGDVRAFAAAESAVALPRSVTGSMVDHHHAHAATAAFTSPFERAAVLVCDEHSDPPVTVWTFERGELRQHDWPWRGPGFAAMYSDCAELFGFGSGSESRLEALARSGGDDHAADLADWVGYCDRALRVERGWKATLLERIAAAGGARDARAAAMAAGFQRSLGDALLTLVGEMRSALPFENLCLGGGLFFNTYFNTRVAESGLFARVFVPANPGNAGLAAGAALIVAAETGPIQAGPVSAFLGPSYTSHEIKATLDNCKLTYEFLEERQIVNLVVSALLRGELVGWFQGAMEWGPRSLGNRSILANPFAPHVLENLNGFLRHRESFGAYGLSVRLEEAAQHFSVVAPSALMELEYPLLDTTRFRHVLPPGVRRVRVQTIGAEPSLFRELHRAFGDAAGAGVLVNTSFNGFHEPIVCSPRDAIRVFYGCGLDMAVLDRFVLRK
jgi:carbamoyltransferase